jgi:hypothetical protein
MPLDNVNRSSQLALNTTGELISISPTGSITGNKNSYTTTRHRYRHI